MYLKQKTQKENRKDKPSENKIYFLLKQKKDKIMSANKKVLDITSVYSTLTAKSKYLVNKLLLALASDDLPPASMKSIRKVISKNKKQETDGRKKPNAHDVCT